MALSSTGVLTFHRCINYGTYWQARCLLQGLAGRGREPVLLNHHSLRATLAEWMCAVRPVLPTQVPAADLMLYLWKMIRLLRALRALPATRRFPLEKPQSLPPFRNVVVGSDEVWNLSHPWYGGKPLFFGENISSRLISYAASFGNYDADTGLAPEWTQRLRRFDAISVRDENSRRLIHRALGSRPAVVLDPCLQFPPAPGTRRIGRQRCLAVYGHNFSRPFAENVRRYAKERDLTIVSVGYRNAWATRQWITASPEDFAFCLAQAEAVATNFFHGCVFALLHNRPLVAELSAYRSRKVEDLLTELHCRDRLVSQASPFADYVQGLDTAIPARVRQRIDEVRQSSRVYLDEAGL